MSRTVERQQQTALKQQDAPIEVLVVDPITLPVARLLAKFRIHPLHITALAFLARIVAAYMLMLNMTIGGAIFACLGFLWDGIDGKIARIRHIDEELHGTVDFLLDQVAFTVLGLGIVIWSVSQNQDYVAILLATWLGAYLVFMAFTSTWNRLLAQNNMGYNKGVGERVFNRALQPDRQNVINQTLKILYDSFMFMRASVARFRMTPYPGAIESEVIVFMIAPLFHYQILILILGVILLIPDILVTLILILIAVLQKRG